MYQYYEYSVEISVGQVFVNELSKAWNQVYEIDTIRLNTSNLIPGISYEVSIDDVGWTGTEYASTGLDGAGIYYYDQMVGYPTSFFSNHENIAYSEIFPTKLIFQLIETLSMILWMSIVLRHLRSHHWRTLSLTQRSI